MSKGFCAHTISGKEFFVDETNRFNEKTWWEMRPTMVLVPASSWAEIKTYVIKVCKRTGQCDKEIGAWERTVQTIETKIIKK